jgi:antitoxin ParD1/3/4
MRERRIPPMAITTMNVSLPDTLKAFVDTQVEEGDYGSASEYIRDLIREDKQRKFGQKLQAMIEEGLNSGPPIVADAAFWEQLHDEIESES